MTEALNSLHILAWHQDMGVDETIGEEPVDRFNLPKETPQSAPKQASSTPVETASNPSSATVSASVSTTVSAPASSSPSQSTPKKPALARAEPIQQASLEETVQNALALAEKATDIGQLKEALKGFEGCPLKKTAANTVFSVGKAEADLMIIGEIPDADEDRQGIPFAGDHGEMLAKMMQAIGYQGGMDDTYATTTLPWRPPGNRKPTPLELESCLPFLKKHIALAKPKCLLIMGGSALRALTGSKERVKKVRGKWIEITIADTTVPAMVTYHPSYLLKQQEAKKETWADLLKIKERLGV